MTHDFHVEGLTSELIFAGFDDSGYVVVISSGYVGYDSITTNLYKNDAIALRDWLNEWLRERE